MYVLRIYMKFLLGNRGQRENLFVGSISMWCDFNKRPFFFFLKKIYIMDYTDMKWRHVWTYFFYFLNKKKRGLNIFLSIRVVELAVFSNQIKWTYLSYKVYLERMNEFCTFRERETFIHCVCVGKDNVYVKKNICEKQKRLGLEIIS